MGFMGRHNLGGGSWVTCLAPSHCPYCEDEKKEKRRRNAAARRAKKPKLSKKKSASDLPLRHWPGCQGDPCKCPRSHAPGCDGGSDCRCFD